MKNITVGYAFCGSFCTIKKSLEALKELAKNDIKIIPIMSQTVYSTDTRFGSAGYLQGKNHTRYRRRRADRPEKSARYRSGVALHGKYNCQNRPRHHRYTGYNGGKGAFA